MTAAFCGQCGTPRRADAGFCPNCGAAVGDGLDDTADREMPAWFASGDPPPQEAVGVVTPTVTVTRAPRVAGTPAPGPAPPPRSANLYVWVAAAVLSTAAVAVVVALLLWPSAESPGQATSPSTRATETTAGTTPTVPPTTAMQPTTTVTTTTRTVQPASWRSWITLETHPSTIRNYPCRQMADHHVPYDFVMDYFHEWNWFYLREGGGGMDQDGNGLPCEGQYPNAGFDAP